MKTRRNAKVLESPPRRRRKTARHQRRHARPQPGTDIPRQLLERLPGILWTTDTELRLTSTGGTDLAGVGIGSNQFIGATLWDFFQTTDPNAAAIVSHRRALAGESVHFESDWQGLTFRGCLEPLRDPAGKVVGVIGTAQDVTERKQAEAALRESADRYRTLQENAYDLIAEVTPDGRLLYLSPNHKEILGYDPSELVGRIAIELIHADDVAGVVTRLAERSARALFRFRHKNGEWRWFEGTGKAYRTAAGEPRGAIISRDITSRKLAEERLASSESRLRAIIEAEPECVKVVAADGTLLEMNPAGLAMIEAGSPEDVIGKSIYPFVMDEYRDEFRLLTERACQGHEGRLEFQMVGLRGTARWADTHTVPLRNEKNEVIAALSVTRDVTERKKAEENTAALLEMAHDIAGTLDLDTLLDRVQRRTAEVLPCDAVITFYLDPAREVLEAISHYGVAPELVPHVEALAFRPGQVFGGVLARGETVLINDIDQQKWLSPDFATRLRIGALLVAPLFVRGRRTGSLVAVRTRRGSPFGTSEVTLCEGIARQLAVALEAVDLYRAREEEAAVSRALAQVGRELISSLSAPVVLDRLCQVTTQVLGCDCSRTVLLDEKSDTYQVAASHGYTAEQVERMRAVEVPRAVLKEVLARLDRLEVSQLASSELAEPLRIGSRQFGITAQLIMALRRGGEIIGVQSACYRGRQKAFTPQQERIARGISQLASLGLENARLVEELERANRVKSDFVATMSHELRTPLNIIVGYNELLREAVFGPVTAEQADTLQRMDRSAQQLLNMINDTLDLSRLETKELPLDVVEFSLVDLITELRSEAQVLEQKSGLTWVWDVASGLPRLHTDPAKLKVVLNNLIRNAAKFTELGSITVRAVARGGGIEISVSDTGIGIDPEALRIIFEPFRQADASVTRRHGGVGLGLYIARRLLDMLGGTIAVESEIGRGSVFRVWVPPGISS